MPAAPLAMGRFWGWQAGWSWCRLNGGSELFSLWEENRAWGQRSSLSLSLFFSFLLNFFFFFDVDHLKSLYWICCHIASVLRFGVLTVRHMALHPQTGDWTCTSCIGGWGLNRWAAGRVLREFFCWCLHRGLPPGQLVLWGPSGTLTVPPPWHGGMVAALFCHIWAPIFIHKRV